VMWGLGFLAAAAEGEEHPAASVGRWPMVTIWGNSWRRKFKAGLYDSTSHRQVDLYPTLHIVRRRRMFCGCRHSIERLVPMTMSNHFHKPPHTQSWQVETDSKTQVGTPPPP